MISRRRFLQWLLSLGLVGAADVGLCGRRRAAAAPARHPLRPQARRWPDDFISRSRWSPTSTPASPGWTSSASIRSSQQTNELERRPDRAARRLRRRAALLPSPARFIPTNGRRRWRAEGAARRPCHSRQPRLVGRPGCAGERPRPDLRPARAGAVGIPVYENDAVRLTKSGRHILAGGAGRPARVPADRAAAIPAAGSASTISTGRCARCPTAIPSSCSRTSPTSCPGCPSGCRWC